MKEVVLTVCVYNNIEYDNSTLYNATFTRSQYIKVRYTIV